MSKRRKKRKSQIHHEVRRRANEAAKPTGPKSASDVTRSVFSKMPDEVSPDLSLQDREVNAEVRRRLESDTAEHLEELVESGQVSSYVDESGQTRYYSTEEQVAAAQAQANESVARAMSRDLPVSEIALNLAEHARPNERPVDLGGFAPPMRGMHSELGDDIAANLQPERGMGGTLSNADIRTDGLAEPTTVGWSAAGLGGDQLLSYPSRAHAPLRGMYELAEGESLPQEDAFGAVGEARLRRDDGTVKGIGGEQPIAEMVRDVQEQMDRHDEEMASQARLDAAVAALDDEDRSDYEKALGLVRAYLGDDYAAKYEQLSEADRDETLKIVLAAARGHRDVAEAQLLELEKRAVGVDREIREIRQQIDPVDPYRRSELLMLLKLRPALALQHMMALSQHLHPLLDEASQGVISTDEMAAKIRERMA